MFVCVLAPSIARSQGVSTDTILTVTEARRDADENLIPDLIGKRITVAGRSNVYSGVIHTERLVVFLEDGRSGIGLYATEFGMPIAEGDSVIATGIVDQFEGMTRLSSVKYRTVIVASPMNNPPLLHIERANAEKHEGRCIRVEGEITSKWEDVYGSYVSLHERSSDRDSMVVFVLSRHKPGIELNKLQLHDRIVVTGVLSQFVHGGALDAGYEIFPRYPEDITVLTSSPKRYLLILSICGGALTIAFAWVIVLRRQVAKQTGRLQDSEVRFRSMFEGANDSILTLEESLKITDANPAACKLCRLSREELVNTPLTEVFKIDHLPALATSPDADNALEVFEFVTSLLHDTPATRFLDAKMNVFDSGKHRRVILVLRDITERKEAEHALKQSVSLLQATLNSTADGILAVRTDGKVSSFNNQFATMWHIPNELVSASDERQLLLQLLPHLKDPSSFLADVEQVYDHPDDSSFDVLELADGRFVERCSLPQYTDQQLVGRVWSFRDITLRRVGEAQQKKLEVQIVQMQKLEAVGTLAAGIAHDFNNLLNGIFGYIELAQTNTQKGNFDKASHCIAKSLGMSGRAKALTLQLMTFAKGGNPLKKLSHLQTLIKDTANFSLTGTAVNAVFDIQDDLWPCEVDEHQIGQVINNIVINACQAMPEGGTVFVSAMNVPPTSPPPFPLQAGEYLLIKIRDTGGGIPAENISRIFEPFFTTKTGGHGLGLSTSYSIVLKHRGQITVESEPEKGSTFVIYLPASRSLIFNSPPLPGRAAKRQGAILVMDDEEYMRDLAASLLDGLGCSVECAIDGTEAVQLFMKARRSGRPFDAVILDLTVPGGVGGREAIQKLLAIDPSVKAIASSGYSDDQIMSRPEEFGFVDKLPKPYSMVQLEEMIGKILRTAE